MKCQKENCNEDADEYEIDDFEGKQKYYYCDDHAHKAGFCLGCRLFWGGVETFDFPKTYGNIKGYCDNCSDEIKIECGEFDEGDVYAFIEEL